MHSREPFLFALAFVVLWGVLEIHTRHRTVFGSLVVALLLIVVALWAGRLGARALRRLAPEENGKP